MPFLPSQILKQLRNNPKTQMRGKGLFKFYNPIERHPWVPGLEKLPGTNSQNWTSYYIPSNLDLGIAFLSLICRASIWPAREITLAPTEQGESQREMRFQDIY